MVIIVSCLIRTDPSQQLGCRVLHLLHGARYLCLTRTRLQKFLNCARLAVLAGCPASTAVDAARSNTVPMRNLHPLKSSAQHRQTETTARVCARARLQCCSRRLCRHRTLARHPSPQSEPRRQAAPTQTIPEPAVLRAGRQPVPYHVYVKPIYVKFAYQS